MIFRCQPAADPNRNRSPAQKLAPLQHAPLPAVLQRYSIRLNEPHCPAIRVPSGSICAFLTLSVPRARLSLRLPLISDVGDLRPFEALRTLRSTRRSPTPSGAAANANGPAPREPVDWHNRVVARSLLSIPVQRPVRHAGGISVPILLIVAEHDTQAPVGPALSVAERTSEAELYRNKGRHYDVYEGGVAFNDVIEWKSFLRSHAEVLSPRPDNSR
jgi:hypothetical protein